MPKAPMVAKASFQMQRCHPWPISPPISLYTDKEGARGLLQDRSPGPRGAGQAAGWWSKPPTVASKWAAPQLGAGPGAAPAYPSPGPSACSSGRPDARGPAGSRRPLPHSPRICQLRVNLFPPGPPVHPDKRESVNRPEGPRGLLTRRLLQPHQTAARPAAPRPHACARGLPGAAHLHKGPWVAGTMGRPHDIIKFEQETAEHAATCQGLLSVSGKDIKRPKGSQFPGRKPAVAPLQALGGRVENPMEECPAPAPVDGDLTLGAV